MFENTRLEHLLEQQTPTTPVAPPPPAAPFTLPHLIQWLEGKQPDEFYDWRSSHVCLLGQYATAVEGRSLNDAYSYAMQMFQANCGPANTQKIAEYVANNYGNSVTWYFGPALKRAKEMQATWSA